MMRTDKFHLLFAFCAIVGCSSIADNDAGVEPPRCAESSFSTADNRRPGRIPPRISRWLAKSKVDFRQEKEASGPYWFEIVSPEPMTSDQQAYIQEYFRNRVAESFARTNSMESRHVVVSVLSEKFEAKYYRGEAAAYGVNDMRLAYDSETRKGMLSMKIRNGDFEGTRQLIREHIKAIVRDKNIRLVGGETPPSGRYYLLGEHVKPGNVLEIEFKSE